MRCPAARSTCCACWAGLANKQIGLELSISEKTLKAHVNAILGKLGLGTRTQAALEASKRGLISPVAALPVCR
jgi:DNA-binding NarL/FixJ family response regulator